MQVTLKNVKYNKFDNINLNIEDNKITGIIGTVGSGKTDLVMLIGKKVSPTEGIIEYTTAKKVGIISSTSYEEMLEGTIEDFIKNKCIEHNYKLDTLDKRIDEILTMVGLKDSILKRNIFNVSKSEKIKILLSQMLLYNPDLIILDSIIEELDSKSRTKLFKLIIKLKKFHNKTIIVTTLKADNIYEFVDNLILLDNGKILSYGNKYEVYDDINVIDNKFISKPLTIEFKNKIKREANIDLGNNESINELIKAIYREVR